jgi:hypothetical protein
VIGRLEVLPGAGTAARFEEVAVWAGPGASNELLAFLVQSARNLGSTSDGGRRIADHLAGVLRDRRPEPATPFATVGPGREAPVALLHGPVQLWDGARWVRPDPAIGWMVVEVLDLSTVLVTASETPAPPSANPILDLQVGVVPGGGLAVLLAPAPNAPALTPAAGETDPVLDVAPASVVETEPDLAPDPSEPLEPEPLGSEPPEPEPTPEPEPPEPEPARALEPEPPEPELGSEPEPPQPEPQLEVESVAGAGPAQETEPGPEPALTLETEPQEPDPQEPESLEHEPRQEPDLVAGPAPAPLAVPGAEPPASWEPPRPGLAFTPLGTVDLRTVVAEPLPALPAGDEGDLAPPGSVMVQGIRCASGHFNHPRAAACLRCGLPLDTTRGPSTGARPPLGVLVTTDGGLWRVDASYLIGAAPTDDPAVLGGQARALVVTNDGQADAVHAELRATDWTLTVVDRHTRSGTFVLPPGTQAWQRVPPDQAVPVRPGTHVAVGSTVFTFTSPWPL